MSLNIKMEKILREKNKLEKKLVNEGLTKKEKTILENLKKLTRNFSIFANL